MYEASGRKGFQSLILTLGFGGSPLPKQLYAALKKIDFLFDMHEPRPS